MNVRPQPSFHHIHSRGSDSMLALAVPADASTASKFPDAAPPFRDHLRAVYTKSPDNDVRQEGRATCWQRFQRQQQRVRDAPTAPTLLRGKNVPRARNAEVPRPTT